MQSCLLVELFLASEYPNYSSLQDVIKINNHYIIAAN